MFNIFSKNINRKRKLVHRFITYSPNENYGTGSGFFISNNGNFLTCFHVAFRKELRQIRQTSAFQKINGNNEHSKLENYYNTIITKAEVEFTDGSRSKAELKNFDEKHDVALFKVSAESSKIKVCKINWCFSLNYGDRVFFGGFPTHPDYQLDKAPLAVHEGVVSSFVETTVGGDKYQHIQINSINLGGNSGAPLFRGRSATVVGIINGNMNWGRDDIVVQNQAGTYVKESLRTPLSIAYATSMKLLKEFVFKHID